jgi:hypothetical protein
MGQPTDEEQARLYKLWGQIMMAASFLMNIEGSLMPSFFTSMTLGSYGALYASQQLSEKSQFFEERKRKKSSLEFAKKEYKELRHQLKLLALLLLGDEDKLFEHRMMEAYEKVFNSLSEDNASILADIAHNKTLQDLADQILDTLDECDKQAKKNNQEIYHCITLLKAMQTSIFISPAQAQKDLKQLGKSEEEEARLYKLGGQIAKAASYLLTVAAFLAPSLYMVMTAGSYGALYASQHLSEKSQFSEEKKKEKYSLQSTLNLFPHTSISSKYQEGVIKEIGNKLSGKFKK